MEKDFNPNIREQTLELSINQLKIQCPSKTMVFGPSGSGKTTLVLNLLRNHYFTEEFSQIILCIPRMAINQMNKTVEEYKKATNSYIQVRIKIVLEFFENFLSVKLQTLFRNFKTIPYQNRFMKDYLCPQQMTLNMMAISLLYLRTCMTKCVKIWACQNFLRFYQGYIY